MLGSKMIAVIDYGAGNLKNVVKALRFLNADVAVKDRPEGLNGCDALVLPGVGAFDDCVNALRRRELWEAARDFIQTGKPFLGICVGYQALFEKSEEFDSRAAGLGVFEGPVVRFSGRFGLKVPQIGWNRVSRARPDCPLFRGIEDGGYFYFVHSYYPAPRDPSIVASRTTYGETFASAAWKDNVYATQFHPEKSQRAGLRLLANFVELTR